MTKAKTREQLREKGQFWTPNWVARAMVSFLLPSDNRRHSAQSTWPIFDPGVGAGAFLCASQEIAAENSLNLHFLAQDVDAEITKHLVRNNSEASFNLILKDYLETKHSKKHTGIIANPPYIRHHRLSMSQKAKLRALALTTIGRTLDGRTGYHVYFFLKSLSELAPGGRLSYIVPSDVFEGVFSNSLWEWVIENFRIHAIATFSASATPFPGVDTNAAVIFISNENPKNNYIWGRIEESNTKSFEAWVSSAFEIQQSNIVFENRKLRDYISIGLHRSAHFKSDEHVNLGVFVKVLRGIATGANEFFLMTKSDLAARNLPERYFVRTIARTRDLDGDIVTSNSLDKLDDAGRPTYLLYIDGQLEQGAPNSLLDYIQSGEHLEFHARSLIRQRRPWYKMEQRIPPPFMFSYLGRRNTRFIRNLAGIRPLTGFLCVYANSMLDNEIGLKKLWSLLQDHEVVENLRFVAKTYGSDAIKVEPRALERTPVSFSLIEKYGLSEFVDRYLESIQGELALG